MVGLGDLPGGDFRSSATGVSADGSVIVGGGHSARGWGEAFRWTPVNGMVGLGDLPGGLFNSVASGVSADGSIVVGHSDVGRTVGQAGSNAAFRWTPDNGMVRLGELPGGDFHSSVGGISADGSVVAGRSHSASGMEAFRWTSDGGIVGLGDLPGGSFFSSASGVSAGRIGNRRIWTLRLGHGSLPLDVGWRHDRLGRPAGGWLQQFRLWRLRRWIGRHREKSLQFGRGSLYLGRNKRHAESGRAPHGSGRRPHGVGRDFSIRNLR